MARTDDGTITINDNVQNDDENLSLEEWTLLDGVSNDRITKHQIIAKKTNVNDKKSLDIDVAREAIQVLESSFLETEKANKDDDINRPECFNGRDEDSDGISVISERDKKNVECQCSNISNIIQSVEKIITPVGGTFPYIILACSLAAAIIGFGIGSIITKEKIKLSTNDINFGHSDNMKCECIQSIDELIKKTPMSDSNIQSESLWKKPKITLEQISNDEKPSSINNNDNLIDIKSFRDTLEKVKYYHDIHCSMIGNIDDMCKEKLSIMNLIDLNDNIENIMTDIEHIDNDLIKSFIEYLDTKLKWISVSIVDDLSKTLRESVMKINRTLNKTHRKLNVIKERICFIRNITVEDDKIHEILNNILGDNCPIKTFVNDAKAESHVIQNTEKKRKKIKHFDKYPIGPEIEVNLNNDNSKVQVENQDNHKKEKVHRDINKELYDKTKKNYESRKNLSKGDFTSKRDGIEHQKKKMSQNHRPGIDSEKIAGDINDENNSDEYCHKNSCTKQRINNKKNFRDDTYENWQFKRSEGRINWREEKKVIYDNDESSWNDRRAKGRKNAREK